jgi:FdhE protein
LADAQQVACGAIADQLTPLAQGLGPRSVSPFLPPSAATLSGQLREALDLLLAGLRNRGTPLDAIIESVGRLSTAELDSRASAVLNLDVDGIDRGEAAIVAAALQACWTARAGAQETTSPSTSTTDHLCPVCSAHPVASLLLTGGNSQGLRYLCCSMCSTQWRSPRIRCVHCGESRRISYCAVVGSDGAVRAEACDDCHTYTKILDLEKRVDLDPFADDLATLALDLMMVEAGYARFGVNPFLIPGD